MELTVNENKMRELIKDVLVEMMSEKKGLFQEILIEAIEEVGLINAIKEGRKNNFVDEERIVKIL